MFRIDYLKCLVYIYQFFLSLRFGHHSRLDSGFLTEDETLQTPGHLLG